MVCLQNSVMRGEPGRSLAPAIVDVWLLSSQTCRGIFFCATSTFEELSKKLARKLESEGKEKKKKPL